MTPPSVFDRRPGTTPRGSSTCAAANEFDLQELRDAKPDKTLQGDPQLGQARPQTKAKGPASTGGTGSPSPLPRPSSGSSWNSRVSPAGGFASKMEPAPLFSGPPPPIASSTVVANFSGSRSYSSRDPSASRGLETSTRANRGGRFFYPHRVKNITCPRDPLLRGLRRQEKALEDQVQMLLDVHAAALVAGSSDEASASLGAGHADALSDTGSSTPTAAISPTATTRSCLPGSLYVPARATADGSVIPVRQPTRHRRQPGLRSARAGLGRSMAALSELKQEERDHVDEALQVRKNALRHLASLSRRRETISAELHSFEDDAQEPLGQELQELSVAHDDLGGEISLLEERLVGMRNRRRCLREKMDDLRSRRDAGLSSYRGALKDAETSIKRILTRPPLQPLDGDMFTQSDEGELDHLAAGMDFLRLTPDRRTVDMARSWWEGEVSALERQQSRVDRDREALDQGSAVWAEVIALVADFEASLRQLVKSTAGQPGSGDSTKGQGKMPLRVELVQDKLSEMGDIVGRLEQKMNLAEEKGWTLLICAIGAELEAFRDAQNMAESVWKCMPQFGVAGPGQMEEQPGESDNEVPQDLLTSEDAAAAAVGAQGSSTSAEGQREVSENEIPVEFLAEHG